MGKAKTKAHSKAAKESPKTRIDDRKRNGRQFSKVWPYYTEVNDAGMVFCKECQKKV